MNPYSFKRYFNDRCHRYLMIWGISCAIILNQYIDVIMTTMASQITSLTVVYSTVYSDADQRKHQSSASLAFVWGFHRDRCIPRTKASYAENVSIWWRHHAIYTWDLGWCGLSSTTPYCVTRGKWVNTYLLTNHMVVEVKLDWLCICYASSTVVADPADGPVHWSHCIQINCAIATLTRV